MIVVFGAGLEISPGTVFLRSYALSLEQVNYLASRLLQNLRVSADQRRLLPLSGTVIYAILRDQTTLRISLIGTKILLS
ncbi:hypothetical protein GCM10007094_35080 [Pseudovibrio japonicus]|uniref:Uncharacterized protein n=1 Tax=Pseudovibrio japonicus TaxID=366534 RepID=A0ABQ3EQQ4_9HYPH|nr:hypothetical protein GCM10007094_35080 [Pseudovibrio japonicus]